MRAVEILGGPAPRSSLLQQSKSCVGHAVRAELRQVLALFIYRTYIRIEAATVIGKPEGVSSLALAYAARGWPVFPCRPGCKVPATRHGFHDASTDTSRIRSWWNDHPTANVAIATGAPGPDVLDIDQHGQAGSGYPAYRRLARAGLLDNALAIVATPSGGLHLYFTGTDQTSGRLPSHHLDFKAVGGYVLAPPSRVGGHEYRLLIANDVAAGVVDWAAVTDLLDPERAHLTIGMSSGTADPARLIAWVERLEEGNRNSGLFWAACRAVESGQERILADMAAAAAATGLAGSEISRTIASARRSA